MCKPGINSFEVKQPSAKESAVETSCSSTQKKILVVDDDAVSQHIYKYLLSRLDVEVHFAETGKEAVEKFKSEQYRLVFMDVRLPVMDGLEATRMIRQLEEGQIVPIIGVTALAMTDDKEKCLAAGMSDYLTKPFSLKDLHATASKWLPR